MAQDATDMMIPISDQLRVVQRDREHVMTRTPRPAREPQVPSIMPGLRITVTSGDLAGAYGEVIARDNEVWRVRIDGSGDTILVTPNDLAAVEN